jgi:hypothetical protein
MESDGSGQVQVITAGGVASALISAKKKKKKRRGKGIKKQEEQPAVDSEQQTVTKKETKEAQFSVDEDFQMDLNATPAVSAVASDMSTSTPQSSTDRLEGHHQNATNSLMDALELEDTDRHQEDEEDDFLNAHARSNYRDDEGEEQQIVDPLLQSTVDPVKMEEIYQHPPSNTHQHELFWLFLCFIGIMASFVCYGLLLEYTTSGGRKLHELSFLFVTSALYTVTAATGRYVRAETPTTIPPARFAILGLTSMGSTFCSVRSLR